MTRTAEGSWIGVGSASDGEGRVSQHAASLPSKEECSDGGYERREAEAAVTNEERGALSRTHQLTSRSRRAVLAPPLPSMLEWRPYHHGADHVSRGRDLRPPHRDVQLLRVSDRPRRSRSSQGEEQGLRGGLGCGHELRCAGELVCERSGKRADSDDGRCSPT